MEVENCLYEEAVASGLGAFSLRISATGEQIGIEAKASTVAIRSAGHIITLKKVAAPTSWLPAGLHVDTAAAWLLDITKHNEVAEQVRVEFALAAMPATVRSGADTGEWLTAIAFEDGRRQVHLGTPDEEWFAQCAKAAGRPQRLVPLLNEGLLITRILGQGLATTVPVLRMGEQFYLHYILAESARRKSRDYPDEWDVATWYAVDQGREALEEAWNNQAQNR